jgi:hypothetical protein
MSTFAQIISRVTTIVKDTETATLYGDLINQGVSEIAGGMQSTLGDWITPPLPELFAIDTVATDLTYGYVEMPETYQRSLQLVVSASGKEISIANSFINFTETYPTLDKKGGISEAIENGNMLYYQRIPSVSETLTLHFYRLPVAMTEDDDTPDGIPEHLQMSLLSNYAAWKSFELIEDGLEDDTPNTNKYRQFFLTALRTLELSIPNDTRELFLR